jgi:hypothetical protein
LMGDAPSRRKEMMMRWTVLIEGLISSPGTAVSRNQTKHLVAAI